MKKLSTLAFLGLAISGSGASADEGPYGEFSANVALTTDYVWRGVSQTDSGPAIQGGFDYAHGSGFYLGAWGSNVDFGNDGNMELDLYGGFKGELRNGLSWGVGVIHYDYPGANDLEFDEVNLGVGYKFLSAKVSYDWDNENMYYEAGVSWPLPQEFGLGLHVGHYDYDDNAVEDYTDWKVGISKSIGGFGLELAYTDTDLDEDSDPGDLADARAVFTLSKSF